MVNGIINTLVAFLMGGATLSFSFTATEGGGAAVSMDGEIITCGQSYRIETPEFVIAFNGQELGVYQKEVDELVLQPAQNTTQAGNAGIMSNPFALLSNDAYEAIPSDVDSRGIPASILLKSKTGAKYTIKILKYASNPVQEPASFILNPENYPTAIVTDLR